jgi:hypothetical protein
MSIMCATIQSASTAAMIGSLTTLELWVAVVFVAIPTALACATAIVLVLTVERRDRLQAIQALPPLLYALARNAESWRLKLARAGHTRVSD